MDAGEHFIPQHGDSRAQPEHEGRTRGHVRDSSEAGAARLRLACRQDPDASRSAGRRDQRHDYSDDCWRGRVAAAVRWGTGAQRGYLAAGLERYPHAAGDVRKREAVGRARYSN